MTKKQIKQLKKDYQEWVAHMEYRHSIGMISGVKETAFNSSYHSIAAALSDMRKAERKLEYELGLLERRKEKYGEPMEKV